MTMRNNIKLKETNFGYDPDVFLGFRIYDFWIGEKK